MGHPVTIDADRTDEGLLDITLYDAEGFVVAGILVSPQKVNIHLIDRDKITLAECHPMNT